MPLGTRIVRDRRADGPADALRAHRSLQDRPKKAGRVPIKTDPAFRCGVMDVVRAGGQVAESSCLMDIKNASFAIAPWQAGGTKPLHLRWSWLLRTGP